MSIEIKNLTFNTIIGVLPFERITPQVVVINAKLHYTFDPSTSDFINYALVAQEIETTLNFHQFELIETALITLSQTLKTTFDSLHFLSITLTKPSILPHAEVGVTYEQTF